MSLRMSDPRAVVVGTTDSVLFSAHETRQGVMVSAPVTNRITIQLRGAAVLDQGINLYPGTQPLLLLTEHLGGALREEIHAISAVAGQTIGVVDIFDG